MTHSRDRYPTPPTFPIADTGLLLAGHAMAVEDPDYDNSTLVSDEIWLDRPPDDWQESAVLLLARVQLDQVVTMASIITGIVDPLADVDLTQAEIHSQAMPVREADYDRFIAEGGPLPMTLDAAVDTTVEALGLRRALPSDPRVQHAFAVDGSITFTHGPSYPACPTLGLKGCDGELEDDPRAIFAAARRATELAATLTVQIKRFRSRAGSSESGHVPDS